jgi:hypothetical protein
MNMCKQNMMIQKKRCRYSSRTAVYSFHKHPDNLTVFSHSTFVGNITQMAKPLY